MTDPKNETAAKLAQLEAIDLASLGLSEVAYLREAEVDGVPGFAIYAADGQAIGFAPGEDSAIAAVMTNDMEVAAVH